MATQQVFDWIQNDLNLSKAISNFECDFSNGYLMGEILSQYRVINDMKAFQNKTNKEAKVKNFYMVEEALRQLNCRFDGKLIHNIMQEERGAAIRLLYQMKIACLNHSRCQTAGAKNHPDEQSMTGLNNGRMHKILLARRAQVRDLSGNVRPNTVGESLRSTKNQRMMSQRTIQFDVTRFKQDKAAKQAEEEFQAATRQRQQNQRQLSRGKLTENQQFMKEWEKEGSKNWTLNQERRQAGIAHVKYFEDREVNIWRNRLVDEQIAATGELKGGVNDFEKNLQKLGIEQHISMEEAIKRQEEKKGIPPGQIQNFSYAATMNKIKETKKSQDFAGKERERRRLKMMVDQLKAQDKLDKEKSEDSLIQKLLKNTAESQKSAYIDERIRNCKQLQFNKRKELALERAQKKKEIDAELEAKRIAGVKQMEAQRKAEYIQQKKDNQKKDIEHTLEKRGLYIEINSGIIDLILDLTDETFDKMQEDSTGKNRIKPADWREFIGLFKDGKKVSTRKVTQKVVQEETQTASQKHLQSVTTDQTDLTKFNAYQILNRDIQEDTVKGLYEYLCQAGQYQFATINPNLWNQFECLYKKQGSTEEFLPSGLLPNQNMTNIIKDLTSSQKHRSSMMQSQQHLFDCKLPSNQNFKLAILGRAFSGKKAVAKNLQDKYSGLKTFSVDAMIKEAVEYVTPKEESKEIPDPKTRNKKGAVTETPVDPFDGKETEGYKRLAEQFKNKLSDLTTPDLADQVHDDALIVDLIVERIALEYYQKISTDSQGSPQNSTMGDSSSEAEMRASIKREREIQDMLQEFEETGSAPADKKGGKGPKGGPDPEALKKELNDLKNFKPIGWILVDFPRTLSQAKLLENKMSGFKSELDKPKDEAECQQETWQKLVSPASFELSESRELPTPSYFDGWLFIESTLEDSMSRSQGRMVDPTTHTVYHPLWNPAPEGDAKLKERLQPFNDEAGSESRVQANSQLYDKRLESLKSWTYQFGLSKNSECRVPLGLSTTLSASPSSESFSEQVLSGIAKLMDFKQEEYNLRRQGVADQIDAEIAAAAEEARLKEEQEKVTVDDQADDHDEPKVVGENSSPVQAPSIGLAGMLMKKQSTLAETLGANIVDKISAQNSTMRTLRAKKIQQRTYELSNILRQRKLEDVTNLYILKSLNTFQILKASRENVFQLLNETQDKFISFLSDPGMLKKKVAEFCDSYNRFTSEYPELLQQEETKAELVKRAQMASAQLWEQILIRKDQALEQRRDMYENGWAPIEKVKLVQNIAQLLELEYQRFHGFVNVSTGWVLNEDVDLAGLCKKLVERDIPIYEGPSAQSTESEKIPTSPILDQLVSYLMNSVENLCNESFLINASAQAKEAVKIERLNFNVRVNSLRISCLYQLQEISNFCDQVFAALDDWIVEAVKRDNKDCQRIVKNFKREIEANSTYLETPEVDSYELANIIEKLEFKEGPPEYMVRLEESLQNISFIDARFELEHLQFIYSQFKDNSQQELIDADTLVTLMIQNLKARRLPNNWLGSHFANILRLMDTFKSRAPTNEQASAWADFSQATNMNANTRKFVNWKAIFVFILLVASEKASQEALQTYLNKLSQVAQQNKDNVVPLEDFIKVDAWFDGTEGPNTSADLRMSLKMLNQSTDEEDNAQIKAKFTDTQRLKDVKTLLWKTLKRPNETGVQVELVGEMFTKLGSACVNVDQVGDKVYYGDLLWTTI